MFASTKIVSGLCLSSTVFTPYNCLTTERRATSWHAPVGTYLFAPIVARCAIRRLTESGQVAACNSLGSSAEPFTNPSPSGERVPDSRSMLRGGKVAKPTLEQMASALERKERDSNPRGSSPSCFQDSRNRPLCHPSADNNTTTMLTCEGGLLAIVSIFSQILIIIQNLPAFF
jgi:hypothetical protein